MSSEAEPLLNYVTTELHPLLNDDVEDVAVQKPGEAFICRRGTWERKEVPISLDDMREIAWLSGSLRKQEVDEKSPIADTELVGGERLHVCVPPTVKDTVSLTFRKHEDSIAPTSTVTSRYRTEGWNKWQRLEGGRDWAKLLAIYDSGDFEALLVAAIHAKLNIIQVGATGSGKTTLSKTCCSAIDHGERLITIEDTLELALEQPNVVRLLYSDEENGVDSATLLKATLRMRANRVLLQEIRDGEAAWTFFSGVVGPHPGVVTTIHGHDARSGISRLAMLLRASGYVKDREDVGALLNNSIDLVIPLSLATDGVRDIFPVWFAGDAFRRHETVADLL